MPKFCGRFVSLGQIALMAGKDEIARPIGPSAAARNLVVEFERHVLLATIHTRIGVFDQEIASEFPTGKLPSLVFLSGYFRILDELHVKTDALDLDARERRPLPKAPGPGQAVLKAGKQRRRQPSLRDTTVEKSWGAVTQIGRAPPPPRLLLGQFVGVNVCASMGHFCKQDGVVHLSFSGLLDPGNGHPGRLGPWIEFERQRLEYRVLQASIFEPDDKGPHPHNHGSSPGQKQPGSFGRTGHQWALPFV
jgi:hypothetical protein